MDVEGRRGRNEGTGTARDHRGRGLASLAKLAQLRWAADNGVERVITDNDALNAPMLAINRRLGVRAVRRAAPLRQGALSGNGFPASAGSTWDVTQTGVVTYRLE